MTARLHNRGVNHLGVEASLDRVYDGLLQVTAERRELGVACTPYIYTH